MAKMTIQDLTKVPLPPKVNGPSYSNVVGKANSLATDYRARMPDLQGQQRNLIQDSGRQTLARAYAGADRAANKRGMFYGGVRAGLRSNAASDVAADTAGKIRDMNLESENTARGIEDTALEAGFNLKNDNQASYNNEYNEALSKRAQSQNQLSGILNAAGTIGGLVSGAGLLTGAAGAAGALNPGNLAKANIISRTA